MGGRRDRIIQEDEQGWSFTSQHVCSGCGNDYALQAIIVAAEDTTASATFVAAHRLPNLTFSSKRLSEAYELNTATLMTRASTTTAARAATSGIVRGTPGTWSRSSRTYLPARASST